MRLIIAFPFVLLLVMSPTDAAKPAKPGKSEAGDELLMIQVLLRHADRAAESDVYITDAAEEVFFRGAGELTSEGIENAKRMGESYRDAYVKNGFIDGRFKPDEVRFQASEVHRVMMSASSFSSGLFKDGGKEPVMAPVYVTPYAEDSLLAIPLECKKGWGDISDLCGITGTSDMPHQLLECMRASNWTCASPPAAQSDTVIAERANKATYRQLSSAQRLCSETGASTFMYSYVENLGGSGRGSDDPEARIRMQRTIGNLANSIVDDFNAMANCYTAGTTTCGEKAKFFYAHDVNQLALMNTFSNQKGAEVFFEGHTPRFSSSLAMELWIHQNIPYVRMYVKDGVEREFREFDYCHHIPQGADYPRVGNHCSLKALENAKNLFITRDPIICN